MKRKVLSLLLVTVLCLSGIINWNIVVKAEETSEDIDISYLLTENALISYSKEQSWGMYYSDGYSVINKISSSKAGVGGVTNAARKCTVSVTTILERKTSSGTWARVTSWTQTNENAYSAMVSKSIVVSSGYYYRVRSYHYASTDSSTSCTNALWIGN